MHRAFALSLAVGLIACAWVTEAFAQDAVAYDDPNDPYDDYDGEQPYDEPSDQSYDQPVDPAVGSIDAFHAALAPYGRWVPSPQHGLIWVPSRAVVGPSFVPYATGGRWQYTSVGWMFESDWDWGWAAFHYGRWYHDPDHGWCWVPGSVWAPAWVGWRFGGGVVGWAPLPPRHQKTVWVFASARDINRPHIDRWVYQDSHRYYRTTAPDRNRVRSGRAYWYAGPRQYQIESAANIRLRPIRVQPPRAGVVVRVRLEGGRVRRERVASPRDRVITRSRRDLPSQDQRQPAVRARQDQRHDVRKPLPAPQPAPPDQRGRRAPRNDQVRTPAAARRDEAGPRVRQLPANKKSDQDKDKDRDKDRDKDGRERDRQRDRR